jgi:prevent-host-death family protein
MERRMRQVNIHEAKTHLSRLVDEAGGGETILVAKAGKPVAALVSLASVQKKPESAADPLNAPSIADDILDSPHIDRRRFGFMKGKISVPDDFDTMFQDEIIAMFEGRE